MLEIQNVTISFGTEQAAVSDVSFLVEEKDKMVVIGETGSGKVFCYWQFSDCFHQKHMWKAGYCFGERICYM